MNSLPDQQARRRCQPPGWRSLPARARAVADGLTSSQRLSRPATVSFSGVPVDWVDAAELAEPEAIGRYAAERALSRLASTALLGGLLLLRPARR